MTKDCVYVCVYTASKKGNKSINKRGKQQGGLLNRGVSPKSEFNWTIVQFNLGLSGFTKTFKAILAWAVEQEKGGRSTCFGSHYHHFPTSKFPLAI